MVPIENNNGSTYCWIFATCALECSFNDNFINKYFSSMTNYKYFYGTFIIPFTLGLTSIAKSGSPRTSSPMSSPTHTASQFEDSVRVTVSSTPRSPDLFSQSTSNLSGSSASQDVFRQSKAKFCYPEPSSNIL